MPRACTVCTHPQREAIETALVQRQPNRRVAAQFAIPETSLRRHAKEHLPGVVAAARHRQTARPPAKRRAQPAQFVAAVAVEAQRGVNVLAELDRCFTRVNKLFDACDGWLTDPDHPDRYDIGPRADEISVVYLEPGIDGPVPRKAKLAVLLARLLKADPPVPVVAWDTKYADPRKLLLETASQLRSQLELVVELMERAHNAQRMAQLEDAILAALGGKDAGLQQEVLDALRPDRLFASPPPPR